MTALSFNVQHCTASKLNWSLALFLLQLYNIFFPVSYLDSYGPKCTEGLKISSILGDFAYMGTFSFIPYENYGKQSCD